jgi:hypothetical protein
VGIHPKEMKSVCSRYIFTALFSAVGSSRARHSSSYLLSQLFGRWRKKDCGLRSSWAKVSKTLSQRTAGHSGAHLETQVGGRIGSVADLDKKHMTLSKK